jgi:ubiquinone/menaquinone biosynthesis C-methylase UbiE
MNKLLYVDVVKKNLDTKIIQKKVINTTRDLSTRITQLLNKLFKCKYNKNLNKIKNQIINTKETIDDLIYSILYIDNLIKPLKTYISNKNNIWISNQLINILTKYNYTSDINIVDIGGGEGNIIKYISKFYNIPNKNLYIVEQQNDWSEKYDYNFINEINYIFWDNIYINIESNSVDIILIMVSLHHMLDTTIDNLMQNINRILKHNGLVIIKEHDCISSEDKIIINWEHHLYHILMSKDLNEENIQKYINHSIFNYKSMKEYNNIFTKYNFNNILYLNRSFNQSIYEDITNSTNLYWALYNKS